MFGLLQAILLVFTYSNFWAREIALGNPWAAFRNWIVIVSLYAVLFASLTQALARALRPRKHEGPPQCNCCGYNLTGLSEPRCPECGTSFDPALLDGASKPTK